MKGPVAVARVLFILAAMFILIGLAFEPAAVESSLLSLAGFILFLVAAGLSFGLMVAVFASPIEKYCLYEIATSPCRQERWQPGKQLCAVCPDDGKCVETASIEVWDIAPGETPAETSPRCTITLRRVRPECGECPQGVPIIGVVEPRR